MGSPEVGADTKFVVLSVLFFITTTRFEVEDLRLREPKNRKNTLSKIAWNWKTWSIYTLEFFYKNFFYKKLG